MGALKRQLFADALQARARVFVFGFHYPQATRGFMGITLHGHCDKDNNIPGISLRVGWAWWEPSKKQSSQELHIKSPGEGVIWPGHYQNSVSEAGQATVPTCVYPPSWFFTMGVLVRPGFFYCDFHGCPSHQLVPYGVQNHSFPTPA